ncbi:glycosyltransferase family 2 protein, partial [Patescibacteria group bacterium]|nr:glycosyltransferase family 2 protein [Patescibacteria group bacterium]
MKLSVHLVTWNGAKYIPYLFESLKKQTFKDWQLFILDNGSTDSTIADCRLQIDEFSIEAKIIESKENLGFAGGHNRLFQRTMNNEQQPSDFVLLLNQDMYLEKDCLEKLVGFMSKNEEVAVVSPRLMYWDFEKCKIDTHRASLCGENAKCKIENSLTSKIDSLGLRVFRNRRVIEKYAGKEWSEIKSMMEMSFRTEGRAKEVFGVSGTLPMFRCSVIEEVGLFDLSYGSYKEDVDLAFRLRSAGHKAFVLLNAVSHHDRTGIDIGPVKNKKNQPEY